MGPRNGLNKSGTSSDVRKPGLYQRLLDSANDLGKGVPKNSGAKLQRLNWPKTACSKHQRES